jgi:hypothetical protein
MENLSTCPHMERQRQLQDLVTSSVLVVVVPADAALRGGLANNRVVGMVGTAPSQSDAAVRTGEQDWLTAMRRGFI